MILNPGREVSGTSKPPLYDGRVWSSRRQRHGHAEAKRCEGKPPLVAKFNLAIILAAAHLQSQTRTPFLLGLRAHEGSGSTRRMRPRCVVHWLHAHAARVFPMHMVLQLTLVVYRSRRIHDPNILAVGGGPSKLVSSSGFHRTRTPQSRASCGDVWGRMESSELPSRFLLAIRLRVSDFSSWRERPWPPSATLCLP